MTRVQLADTDLYVHPLQLGGNTFGCGADRDQSFAVLDAYAEAGGNFIDTADAYPAWVDGNSGGESETIIGEWMKSRGNRDEMVIATEVGKPPEHPGLAPATASTIPCVAWAPTTSTSTTPTATMTKSTRSPWPRPSTRSCAPARSATSAPRTSASSVCRTRGRSPRSSPLPATASSRTDST